MRLLALVLVLGGLSVSAQDSAHTQAQGCECAEPDSAHKKMFCELAATEISRLKPIVKACTAKSPPDCNGANFRMLMLVVLREDAHC